MSRPDLVVSEPSHVGHARLLATTAAKQAGLPDDRIPLVALATTELATNLLKHASQGVLTLNTEPGRLDVLSLDRGPGIGEVTESLRDGYSTTGTLGGGLGAVHRAADVFDLYTLPGAGTAALARWQLAEYRPAVRVGAALRTAPGELRCGDLWAAWYDEDLVTVSISDGLGHGPAAEAASQVAVAAVAASRRNGRPADVLAGIQSPMAATRGATVAVLQIAPRTGRLRFCGIGNIAGRLYATPEARAQRLVSRPGIVGASNAVGTAELTSGWEARRWVLLYTDGVSDRWSLDEWPGLLRHDPATVAAWILAQRGRGRDDSCVVAVTGGDTGAER